MPSVLGTQKIVISVQLTITITMLPSTVYTELVHKVMQNNRSH